MLREKVRGALAIGITPRALVLRTALLRALHRLPKEPSRPPTPISRILFSFPYHSVGDLILSLTLLDRIHDRWPQAQIDVAVGTTMAPLVAAIPYVHSAIALQRPRTRPGLLAEYAEVRNLTKLFQREIAGTHYELAFAPRWDSGDSFLSAYFAYLTAAPIRCGYSGLSDGGNPEVDRLLTIAAKGGANEHESLRYTRLLGRCGFEPRGAVCEDEAELPIRALTSVAQVRRLRGMSANSPKPKSYAVFSPGATNGRRIWPIERFSEVGRALHQIFGLKTIVIGSLADATVCLELASKIGNDALSMAGKTDPLQMLDLISEAALFLGNDSGPGHMAGGLGIETIIVSPFAASCTDDHPNSPLRFRPRGPHVHILQPQDPLLPCNPTCSQSIPHCILQVSAEEVLAHSKDAVLRSQAREKVKGKVGS